MPIELNLTADRATKDIKRIAEGLEKIVSLADKEIQMGKTPKNLEKLTKQSNLAIKSVKELRKQARAAIQLKVNSSQAVVAINRLKKLKELSASPSKIALGKSSGDGVKKLSSNIKDLSLNITNINESWAKVITSMRTPAEGVKQISKDSKESSQELNKLNKQLEQSRKYLAEVNAEAKKAEELGRNTRAASSAKKNHNDIIREQLALLQKENSALKNNAGALREINKLKNENKSLKKESAADAIRREERELRALNAAYKDNAAAIERINKLKSENKQLRSAGIPKNTKDINQNTEALKRNNKAARGSKTDLDQLSAAFMDSSQSAAAFRAALLASGHSMGLFTAHTLVAATSAYALVKAIQAVIVIGSTFQKSLAETSAIMGEEVSNMFLLSDSMKRLAENTKFTITEVAEAGTILAKTGMDQMQIMESLPATLNLAAIGGMDMAKASDIAANAMFGFGLQAKDVEMVTDTLAYTATRTNSSVTQLGSALSYVAPMAAAAGANIKDVTAMLGVMHDSGVKGTRAGTALRRSYANLLDPADKVVTVLSDLGVETRNSSGEMRSMVDIVTDLAYQGANAADLTEIFGVRAAPGMISLWADINKEISGGTSKLKELKSELYDVDGIAEEMRHNMEKNLIDVWQKFGSVVSVKLDAIFSKIGKSLMDIVEMSTTFVRDNIRIGDTFHRIGIYIEQWNRALSFSDGILKDIGGYIGSELSGSFKSLWEIVKLMGTAIAELPENLVVIGKSLGALIGLMSQTIKSTVESWSVGIVGLGSSIGRLFDEAKVSAGYGVDYMVEYMVSQFKIAKLKVSGFLSDVWNTWQLAISAWYTKLGNLVESVNVGGASKALKETSEFLLRVGRNSKANAKSDSQQKLMAAELERQTMLQTLKNLKLVKDAKLSALKQQEEEELKVFNSIKSGIDARENANIDLFNQTIDQILKEKEARLASIKAEMEARKSSTKQKISDELAWVELLKQTDAWDSTNPDPSADFLITGMKGQLTGQGFGQNEFNNARLPYEGPSDKEVKSHDKDLKHFIKLQKILDGEVQGSIAQLEKLGEISPYESLTRSADKTNKSIKEVTAEYETSLKALTEAEKEASAQSYSESKGSVIREEIEKLNITHKDYVETLKAEALATERALELAERYRTVTNADGTTRTVQYNPINSAGESRTAKEEVRQVSLTPEESLQEQLSQDTFRRAEALAFDLENLKLNQEQKLELIRQFELDKQTIELDSWQKSMELRGSVMGDTAQLIKSGLEFDKENILRSTSSMMSALGSLVGGFDDGSKKAFENKKNVALAGIVVDTGLAVMDTYAAHGGGLWGAAAAGAMALVGAQNYKQVQATTYKSPKSLTSATPTAPSIPQVPAASDAFFQQTANGSSATNTQTAGRPEEGAVINFNVSAVDAPSFDRLIGQREGIIVGMVQKAFTENGRRGGPIE